MKAFIKYVIIFFFSIIHIQTFATHLRAGEIHVEPIIGSNLLYKISIVIYSDKTSNVLPGEGILDFGDGSKISPLVANSQVEIENLDNKIAKNTYILTHQYSGDKEQYTIGYQEVNRNPGIINMLNSVNTPFYIETTFLINPPCGNNNTPVLSIPPIDFGIAGALFIHNPGAYDIDGDSLSFRLVIPKQTKGIDVNDYSFPSGLTLDSKTGKISWPVPSTTGQYNLAFIIDEWRIATNRAVLISSTERDMQIIVVDSQGQSPEIVVPKDTCLEAGDYISEPITVNSASGNQVKLEPFGKPFWVSQSPAVLIPDSIYYEDIPIIREFSWQTDLTHISAQPYNIHFKASDNTGGSFPKVDFETWKIKVSAPAPENLDAKLINNGNIRLTWSPYAYGADQIIINRRIAGYDFPVSNCDVGIPFYSHYDKIKEVNGILTNYEDVPTQERFVRGARYCYRLLASIPGCSETESAASKETCVDIPVDAPVITNVSVLKTDSIDGKIFIRWTSSFDIDITSHDTSHFSYRLQRGEGFTGKRNETIITPNNFTDTVFTDTSINTENKIYHYIVYLFENNQIIDSSSVASMVRLSSNTVIDKIGMNWQAEVPWSNNTKMFPYHYIYRDRSDQNNPESFTLIDSVNVNLSEFKYVDSAQFNKIALNGKYCYYVTTFGSYGNPRILSPLINKSQIFCAYKNDTIPPCTPELTIMNINDCSNIENIPCDINNFYNDLSINTSCDDSDISGYKIFFSENLNTPFYYVGFTNNLNFRHDNLKSFKGCYKALAFDYSGNYSDTSKVVCNDNCPFFKLPNIFTPNADGFNDSFTEINNTRNDPAEIDCTNFVKEIQFSVYNRWGEKIYSATTTKIDSVILDWDGKDNSGKKVDAGIYYYSAIVRFDVLDPKKQYKTFKGWVQILY